MNIIEGSQKWKPIVKIRASTNGNEAPEAASIPTHFWVSKHKVKIQDRLTVESAPALRASTALGPKTSTPSVSRISTPPALGTHIPSALEKSTNSLAWKSFNSSFYK